MKWYTVIGYYESDMSGMTHSVRAENVPDSIRKTFKTLSLDEDENDMMIVDVIAGKHDSVSGNDKVQSVRDILEE